MFKQLKLKIEMHNSNIVKKNFKISLLTHKEFHFSYSSYFRQFKHLLYFDNVPSRIMIEDNYYTTKQPLIFKHGKLTLLNTRNCNLIQRQKNLSKILTTFLGISLTCSLITYSYLYLKLSTILTIFTLGLCLFKYKLQKTFYRIIIEINILENGKFVEIVTLANKFELDIKYLNKPSKLQISTFNKIIPDLINAYNPLIVDNGYNKGVYLIPADMNIYYNKELINAIIYKSYIVAKNKIGKNDLMTEN